MEPPKKGEATVTPSSATVTKPDGKTGTAPAASTPGPTKLKDSGRKGGGSGPSNSVAFESLPAKISPVPPLEVCWKCVRCYGVKLKPLPFKKACLILAVVLIAEGLLRLAHNLVQALVDFHVPVRSENFVLVFVGIGSGMYHIPSVSIREALLEPFYTIIGATEELSGIQDPNTKSLRFVFYAAAFEKVLYDVAPGLGLLLLVLSIIKGQQAALVALIISALIGLSAIFTLIQIPVCVALGLSVPTNEGYQQNFCGKLDCSDALFPFYLIMASPLTILLLALKIHSFKCVFALFRSLKASSSIRPAGAMMPSLGPAPAVPSAATIMPEESKATVAFENEQEGGAKKKEKAKVKAAAGEAEPEENKEEMKTAAMEEEGVDDGEKTKKKGSKKTKKKKEKRGSKTTKKKKGKKKKSAE